MEFEGKKLTEHEAFEELCALSNSGTLTPLERAELNGHLQICAHCREVYDQYTWVVRRGIPLVSARYAHAESVEKWDDRGARQTLLARVRAVADPAGPAPDDVSRASARPSFAWRLRTRPLWLAFPVLAVCLMLAVAAGAYLQGSRAQERESRSQNSFDSRFEKLSTEKRAVDELLAAQTRDLAQLQSLLSQKEQEIAKLRRVVGALDDRATELEASRTSTAEQLRSVLKERDSFDSQLQVTEARYEKAEGELASFRAERSRILLHSASLESKVEELTAANRDEERKLRDDEAYLASDRDIRELIGARGLYIADVFDVDSRSQTRKPFGRVFYTEGKSLIFYAFDLDRRPGIKNSNTFQAWGKKESGQGRPLSLGILYMDNEANRRWVLRCDDARQLAEIDAVFVTVEPHGGSEKPTGKPYLYALLRKEANHP